MKEIVENKFWTWLMWLLPIVCIGWFSVCLWTLWQVISCVDEIKKTKQIKTLTKERAAIIEMNKIENLTEKDKRNISGHSKLIKVGENSYIYDWD